MNSILNQYNHIVEEIACDQFAMCVTSYDITEKYSVSHKEFAETISLLFRHLRVFLLIEEALSIYCGEYDEKLADKKQQTLEFRMQNQRFNLCLSNPYLDDEEIRIQKFFKMFSDKLKPDKDANFEDILEKLIEFEPENFEEFLSGIEKPDQYIEIHNHLVKMSNQYAKIIDDPLLFKFMHAIPDIVQTEKVIGKSHHDQIKFTTGGSEEIIGKIDGITGWA